MSNSRRHNLKFALVIAVIAVIICAAALVWVNHASKDSKEEETEAIRDSIRQRALQCYVIEGAYPESLDYLIDNYGLTINREDYKIVYMPYAENMPPEVKVVSKKDK